MLTITNPTTAPPRTRLMIHQDLHLPPWTFLAVLTLTPPPPKPANDQPDCMQEFAHLLRRPSLTPPTRQHPLIHCPPVFVRQPPAPVDLGLSPHCLCVRGLFTVGGGICFIQSSFLHSGAIGCNNKQKHLKVFRFPRGDEIAVHVF